MQGLGPPRSGGLRGFRDAPRVSAGPAPKITAAPCCAAKDLSLQKSEIEISHNTFGGKSSSYATGKGEARVRVRVDGKVGAKVRVRFKVKGRVKGLRSCI